MEFNNVPISLAVLMALAIGGVPYDGGMGRGRRRRLGQHFLADRGVVARIVGLLEEEPGRVLEIGPGRGALTGMLVERFPRVVALEVDGRLVGPLEARFDGVEVRHGDALTEELEGLLGEERPWQVAANLPYSVGTAILRRLLPRHDLFSRLVIMLQREVAERIVAEPGDRNHGLLALERAGWADARIAFHVPPRAFRPRPRVESSVVVLEPRSAPFEDGVLRRALAVAAHALRTPRKMLSNAVRPLADARAIEAVGLDPSARPAAVPLEGWVRLVDYVGGA